MKKVKNNNFLENFWRVFSK